MISSRNPCCFFYCCCRHGSLIFMSASQPRVYWLHLHVIIPVFPLLLQANQNQSSLVPSPTVTAQPSSSSPSPTQLTDSNQSVTTTNEDATEETEVFFLKWELWQLISLGGLVFVVILLIVIVVLCVSQKPLVLFFVWSLLFGRSPSCKLRVPAAQLRAILVRRQKQ